MTTTFQPGDRVTVRMGDGLKRGTVQPGSIRNYPIVRVDEGEGMASDFAVAPERLTIEAEPTDAEEAKHDAEVERAIADHEVAIFEQAGREIDGRDYGYIDEV